MRCTFVRDRINDDYSLKKVQCIEMAVDGRETCSQHTTHLQVARCNYSHGADPQPMDDPTKHHSHSFGVLLCEIENIGRYKKAADGRLVIAGPVTCSDCNARLESGEYIRYNAGAAPAPKVAA